MLARYLDALMIAAIASEPVLSTSHAVEWLCKNPDYNRVRLLGDAGCPPLKPSMSCSRWGRQSFVFGTLIQRRVVMVCQSKFTKINWPPETILSLERHRSTYSSLTADGLSEKKKYSNVHCGRNFIRLRSLFRDNDVAMEPTSFMQSATGSSDG